MADPTETNEAKIAERFAKDIATHEVEIILDDGVHRHIAFRRPNTGAYAFALTTWPGHLCISGDMGCYVFARLRDMFEFFRHDRINASYWAEKLQADDPRNGHRDFSMDLFRAAVMADFEGWSFESDEQRSEALTALEDELDGGNLGHFETSDGAVREVQDYVCPVTEKGFQDFWEHALEDYTFHFLWSLHAIRWGVEQYDKAKAAAPKPAPLRFTYRNWRGETAVRTAIPTRVHFASTEWHPEPQWLLTAFDVEKDEDRDFAMADMQPETAGALRDAVRHLLNAASQTYRKRNGSVGSLEGEDGEASFILPFEAFDALRIASTAEEDRAHG